MSTMDNKYVYSRHDGVIIGLEHEETGKNPLYKQKFSSPVVRVFDIARPVERNTRDIPLVVLPQPLPTDDDDQSPSFISRRGLVFVNTTESGGWYAMSENSYPLVTGSA